MPRFSFKVNPEYAKIAEIIPGLCTSGVSALQREIMEEYRITLILNVTTEVPNLKSLGDIPRVKIWIDDDPQAYIYPLLEQYIPQIDFELKAGGRVLIHCVAGVSRSALFCLAFLVKYRSKSLREAYYLMASKRPKVRPNIGFWRQLIHFEQVSTFEEESLIYSSVEEIVQNCATEKSMRRK
ncbi:hypothetical protein AB6A40_008820 [Gnathostoma spinigerum]|uniref:Protein-tyrosine-phosphatase n=1 Tax=Gnathostoma spinigerum TaxID=75299 RepID=A0ABD6ES11_9BILA